MAARDPLWHIGESENYTSSGPASGIEPIWVLGESHIRHEYVPAAGNVPYGDIMGQALNGCFRGGI